MEQLDNAHRCLDGMSEGDEHKIRACFYNFTQSTPELDSVAKTLMKEGLL